MKAKTIVNLVLACLFPLALGAQADTYVANANVYYGTAPGCYWVLTYSSGGGGAPQFYDLSCNGSKVVTQQKVGGQCYFYNLAAGYRTEGSGCNTSIYRIETPPPPSCGPNSGKIYAEVPYYAVPGVRPYAEAFCGACGVIVSNPVGGYQTLRCGT